MEQETRYNRQMLFPPLGEKGQEMLAKAAVVQVGCGALGSTIASCMVRSGVGRYTIIDHDVPEISNLHRQSLFDEEDVKNKANKALAAADKLKRANSEVEVKAVPEKLIENNADEFLAGHDLVLDALDNMETRFLINDWCVANNVPWIYSGVGGASGMTMAILPGKGPCLQCLFPDRKEAIKGALTTLDAGILNVTPTTFGALQAAEAMKYLIKSPDLITDLRMFDLWSGDYQRIRIERNQGCECCGTNRSG
jgi:adenylyltransferase/sulfurtransferase